MMLKIEVTELLGANPLMRNINGLGWDNGFCIFSDGGAYAVSQTIGNAFHTLPVNIYLSTDIISCIEHFGKQCQENPDTKQELSVQKMQDRETNVWAVGISRV